MSDDNADSTKALMPPSAKREQARRNAQDHFAASQKRDSDLRKEIDREQAVASAKIAKLRALRLAKEEEDRAAAAAAPPVKKGKSVKKAKVH
jgi:hypothetical protein